MAGKPLDETDRRFFQHLREEGRRSNAAIAREIGPSRASSRQRVARMQQDKIISIATATCPTVLGSLTAGIRIDVDGGYRKNLSPVRTSWAISEHD